MDTLTLLLSRLSPRCEVNLHCRFGGRWESDHEQLQAGVVPWHVILRGEGRLTINAQRWQVREGDVLLLPQGSPHLIESLVDWGRVLPVAERFTGAITQARTESREQEMEMLCGEFYFGRHSAWLFAQKEPLLLLQSSERDECPELQTLLNMLVRESLANQPGGEVIVQRLADTFLVLLLRALLSTKAPPAGLLRLMNDHRLMPAVHAVLAAPEQPWTLEKMAECCFLSRATFARHFARAWHTTPLAWLTQLRMTLAAQLLQTQPQANIETIAAQCGFQSLASFSRAFKKEYTHTPGIWRRLQKGDIPPLTD